MSQELVAFFCSLSWYHNGVPRGNVIAETNSSSILVIKKTRREHGGNYMLRAVNQHGTACSPVISLQLAGKVQTKLFECRKLTNVEKETLKLKRTEAEVNRGDGKVTSRLIKAESDLV
jgi:hypothetical protein